jgi:hypothetical protein
MTGFSSLDWNFAIRSRTALAAEALPEGDREGLSPGLRRPEVVADADAGGERLLERAGLDVLRWRAAMRSERLAPAFGRG